MEKKKIEYKSVKQNIDLAKLKRGEYELADVVDEKGNIDMGGIKLGIYDSNEIILKRGKYGLYFVWGEQKKYVIFFIFGFHKDVDNIY